MRKLAIVTTHPIQYYAPWFKLLATSDIVTAKVFYTWGQSQDGLTYDPGFGKEIAWDINLLEGYDYTFVKNVSVSPGSNHFKGIINPSLNQEIESWQADAVLIIGWNFHSHLQCIRYFHKKIPVFFRGDSTLLDKQSGIKKTLRFFLLRWVYHFVDYAFYAGTNNKNYFLKYGLKEKQLIFAPHAIDNERFANTDNDYENNALCWRRELGILDDDLVILFAGKLEPKKTPFLLLELSKKIQSEKVKFIFVGNGILEKELKNGAKGDTRILFIDFQNQQKMPVVYRLSDIFILPSKGPGETWGLAVNEAMACGRPVIISDKVGCGDDLVKNNVNGFIFDSCSLDSIVDLINRLMANRPLLKEMGDASKETVRDFSFGKIVEAIEKAIISL